MWHCAYEADEFTLAAFKFPAGRSCRLKMSLFAGNMFFLIMPAEVCLLLSVCADREMIFII